jgi:lysozyme
MDLQKLQNQLIEDEGCVYEIYLDHLGLPTFGIGHLVKDNDEEKDMPVGSPISKERVDECFAKDTQSAIEECSKLFDDFDGLPDKVQLVVVNMMFNLGYPRLSGFKKMIKAMNEKDWNEAANQMVDSKWYNQVPNRAKRLVEEVRSCG